MKRLLVCAVIVVTLGCASTGQSLNEETLRSLASKLTKLSTAAESAVRYKNAPKDLTDRPLLEWATTLDPSLLEPFLDYTLKVLRQDRHAVVLVCTKDGAIALLEDVACTGWFDSPRWLDTPGAPCEFTIEPRNVC